MLSMSVFIEMVCKEIISFSSVPPCGSYQFECSSHQECMSHSKRCDGNNDCLDGSDETDCGKSDIFVKIIDYT